MRKHLKTYFIFKLWHLVPPVLKMWLCTRSDLMYSLSQSLHIISNLCSGTSALTCSIFSLTVWKQCLKLSMWDKVRVRPRSTDTWVKAVTHGLARENRDKESGNERARRFHPANIKWNVRKVSCQDYLALGPHRPSLGLIIDNPKP